MSISATLKSKKVVFAAAITAFVVINTMVVIHVYRKNTTTPIEQADDGGGSPMAAGVIGGGASGGGGGAPNTGGPANPGNPGGGAPAKAAPPKMEAIGKEDGVFRDETRVNIYAGHGVLKAKLPYKGTLETTAFQYRDLDVPPLDKIDITLMRYNDATFKLMTEVGVTAEQVKKFRAAKGFPPVYPPETMKNCMALFSEYDKAEEAAKPAALEKVVAAVKAAGDEYVKTFATNFGERKGAMTPEQYAAYKATMQKGIDEAEAKAAADKAERDRIAKEKQEADRVAAATRAAERAAIEKANAATRAAVAPTPAPVDPNKPRPLPYPPPPWEIQGEGVHIP